MLQTRELSMDDYIAVVRRHLKLILIPTLIAPVVGFGISYAFKPKYTSQSLVLVEGQKVAEGYVQPLATDDISERVERLEERVLSRDRLQPVLERLGLAKGPNPDINGLIDGMRTNLSIQAIPPGLAIVKQPGSSSTSGKSTTTPTNSKTDPGLAGFYINYTASDPHSAQRICTELTSLLLQENLIESDQVIQNTTDFLSRQIDEAKHSLEDQGNKLMAFKTKYMGGLPGDQETNLKVLGELSSELDANTQALSRAQQDRTYTESQLSAQVAAWKANRGSTDPQALQQQINQLEGQLLTLRVRYTDDYPDVIKVQNDIASLKKTLNEIQSRQASNNSSDSTADTAEPPEIQQLRSQLHRYDEVIADATHEQERLQAQIRVYQSRVELSPELEEQYRALSRDYDSAQKFYQDLLAKRDQSQMQADVERRNEGKQMRLLNPADLPDSPSFPVRWQFGAGGLGAGLAIAVGLVMWLEMRDKAMRTEEDVHAALALPTLMCLPWVGPETDLAIQEILTASKNRSRLRSLNEKESDEVAKV